ncbi:MAG: ATP F0F1 synthase subunit B, partial [Gemmobacter sp.]
MKKLSLITLATLLANPAFAAEGPFVSLRNTN